MAAAVPPPDFALRPIEPRDDAAVAQIIRTVMPEFGACGSGYAIEDPEVDRMYATFTLPRSAYWVLVGGGNVIGGGGIAPLRGGDGETCELQKMYFLPEARGHGLGRRLLEMCLGRARELGFRRCYLETLTRMHAAQRLYLQAGFLKIDAPLGRTGHFSCDSFYLREL